MSYYEKNKEKVKEYNLKRYHNLENDKKQELNDKRSVYYKQYYDETKTLKGVYNKSKAFDKKEYYKMYEIKNNVKLRMYRHEYYKKKYLNIEHNV